MDQKEFDRLDGELMQHVRRMMRAYQNDDEIEFMEAAAQGAGILRKMIPEDTPDSVREPIEAQLRELLQWVKDKAHG